MARGKTLSIPEELLVRHVLAVTRDADWPVQRAALEALLRRCAFARRDDLRVARRPGGGEPFGLYSTRRPRQAPRPYETVLEGLDPPRGSCDCPDFLRNSLGLCKHLLVVMRDLAARPRKLARALVSPVPEVDAGRPRLVWDPIRPLTGEGDWLARVRLVGVNGRRGRRGAGLDGAMRWFRRAEADHLALRNTHLSRPDRRAELVRDLLPLLRRSAGRAVPAHTPDPALRSLLHREHRRLSRITSDTTALTEMVRHLRSLRRHLYPYQRKGVRRFLAAGRLLLADDMGLGKTAQAIAACHVLWHAGKVRRGLLLVPASLKPQWRREWELFSAVPVTIVEGDKEQRREVYREHRKGFLIANYEQVHRDLEEMHTWRPDIVVLDEAQRIKNWATKTAVYVKKLRPPYRLVLTGTPMENRLEELASILDWVDDLALEPKWRLEPWHAVLSDGPTEVRGSRNLGTLRQRLASCLVRRLRADILTQLPPRTDTILPVDLTPEQQDAHDELNQPIAKLLAMARRRPLTQAEFLRVMSLLTTQRMLSNGIAQVDFPEVWPKISGIARPGPSLLKSLSSPKLLELREILDQVAVQQGRKVVVFSQWRRMLSLAHWATKEVLERKGLRAAFFTGQEKQKRRTQNIVEFHDDPDARVLFATDAGGVGLNLQRAASCCVNIELPWNPAVLEQRIGRIYRIGQKAPIDVYNLVSRNCIESRIQSLVSDKRALFEGLFDGDRDEIRFDHSGSFLSTIEKVVEPARVPDLPETEEGVGEADMAIDREVDEVLAASDESQDETRDTPGEREARRERAEGVAPVKLPPAVDVEGLFSQLEIAPTAQGGVRIEAPPEAAAALAAVFEGLAGLLRRGVTAD
jgi:hypothetical protein